jgi:hypothetical protein
VKKFLLLLVVILVVFVVYYRHRLYLRDPLGNVTRDGVKEDGTQVFLNYSNEVLLENDQPPMFVMLVQRDDHVGLPLNLKCLHFVACLTDADTATLAATEPNVTVESMTGKAVTYRAGKHEVVVTLR